MKNTDRIPHDKAREIIVQNAQKGELYQVMFAGDPVTYIGVPVALPGVTSPTDDRFELRIEEPDYAKGIERRSIHEIVWLQKCT